MFVCRPVRFPLFKIDAKTHSMLNTPPPTVLWDGPTHPPLKKMKDLLLDRQMPDKLFLNIFGMGVGGRL